MPDRIECLNIEMDGQRKLFELEGDALGIHGLKITAQRKIDVGSLMRPAQSARTEDDRFIDLRMPRQHAPDGIQSIYAKTENHGLSICSLSNKYSSWILAR